MTIVNDEYVSNFVFSLVQETLVACGDCNLINRYISDLVVLWLSLVTKISAGGSQRCADLREKPDSFPRLFLFLFTISCFSCLADSGPT